MPQIPDRHAAFLRAKNLADQGQFNEAIDRVQRLLAESPGTKSFILQCAVWLAKVNRPEEIIRLMQDLPLAELQQHELVLLGDACLQKEKFDKAAEVFFCVQSPDIKIVKKHARALFMAGRNDEALKVARRGYQMDSKIIGALNHWATECARQDKSGVARNIRQVIRTLTENGPRRTNASPQPSRSKTEQATDYAKWLLDSGQIDSAIQKLLYAVSSAPRNQNNIGAITELANKLRQERRYGAAISVLEKCRKLMPDSVELMYLHGQALLEFGEPQSAIYLFDRVRSLNPQNADLIVFLSRALEQTGELDRMIALLREGHKAHPEHLDILTMLGGALSKSGNHPEALQLLQPIHAERMRKPHIASVFGAAYLDAGNYTALDKLLNELPQEILNDPSMLYVRAYYHFLRYEPEVARRILQNSMEEQRGITPAVILYLACADADDAIRSELAKRFGERAYKRAQDSALNLNAGSKMPESIQPKYGARLSNVMTSPLYCQPVNGTAARELKPWLLNKRL